MRFHRFGKWQTLGTCEVVTHPLWVFKGCALCFFLAGKPGLSLTFSELGCTQTLCLAHAHPAFKERQEQKK
jgi:hypothetical protein